MLLVQLEQNEPSVTMDTGRATHRLMVGLLAPQCAHILSGIDLMNSLVQLRMASKLCEVSLASPNSEASPNGQRCNVLHPQSGQLVLTTQHVQSTDCITCDEHLSAFKCTAHAIDV